MKGSVSVGSGPGVEGYDESASPSIARGNSKPAWRYFVPLILHAWRHPGGFAVIFRLRRHLRPRIKLRRFRPISWIRLWRRLPSIQIRY